MDILEKIDNYLTEGAVPRTEKTVNMTHKTSGKEIVVTARSIKKYEKLGYELNESTIKRFDDVHIVSKNKTGIVYDIKGNRITVRTVSGDITVNKSDVRLVSESSDDLSEMAKKVKVNDFVTIKAEPINSINRRARVVAVEKDGVRVKNLNMPFQGTFNNVFFKWEEIESGKNVSEMAKGDFAGWVAFYNGKRLEITKDEAKDLWGATQLARNKFKVPKSKYGMMAIKPGYEE